MNNLNTIQKRKSKDVSISYYKKVKNGIWFYFFLLIFEGAIRKWVFPSLSNQILLIRDPVAIWLLYLGAKYKINYSNSYIKITNILIIACIFLALVFGHKNIFIALFGARIYLIHFPLIFLIGKVFNREDVLRIGKFSLLLAIPMIVLVIAQFYSSQIAFVNIGVGGLTEAGFGSQNGYFRPSATFSFTGGNVLFFSFVISFIFYFLFYDNEFNKWILYPALIAAILAIPFSISRTLLFSAIITVFSTIISFKGNVKKQSKLISGLTFLIIFLVLASQLNVLNTGIDVFVDRFTNANEQEGGLNSVFLDRFLGGLINGILHSGDPGKSFFGYGIGYGSNFASKLLTNGDVSFLVDEVEWGRTIGELGPLFGILVLGIRILTTLEITKKCYLKLKQTDPLPWILLSFSFFQLLQGQLASPFGLGFFVISGGLTLAALKNSTLN